jgi:cell division protein FtsA
MNLEPIVAVEIGTTKVRVFVGEPRDDGGLVITAVGDCASSGMRKGELFHAESVGGCLERALKQAEDAAGLSINEVHLTMSGSQIEALPNRGEIPVAGEITEEHVEHVRQVAKEVTLPADRQILHSIVGQFCVDGLCGVMPVGMVGHKLSADVLIVHGVQARMFNMVKVVKSLKLEVADLLFAGLCSSMAALSPEQKRQGVLLIDLGGGTTDYMVYAHAQIADAGALGVGGDHVTNDLARAFRISTMEAEALKLQYGDAMVSAAGRTRRIPLPTSAGEAPRHAKLSDVQTVAHVRMEETFGLIRARLQRQQLLNLLGGGVVLTGGGAYLKNVVPLAQKVFGLPCEIGGARNVSGLTDSLARPEYATGVGAVLCAYKALRSRQAADRSIWKKLGHWFGVGG